jgi:tetratricopeptide (TPR) repeat protein
VIILTFLWLAISPWTLYESARDKFDKGEFDAARIEFEELLEEYPNHKIAPYVIYYIGRLTKYPAKALSYYQRVVDLYPESKVADNALYRVGQYYYAVNDYQKAYDSFRQVIKEYPKSDVIKDARVWAEIAVQLVEKPSQYYAIQIGAFQNKENAERLKEQFSQKGYTVQIVVNKFYKVWLGRFASREEAEKFKSEHNFKGYIVRSLK